MARMAITGSTGLIGEALVAALLADGHDVQRVVRRRDPAAAGEVFWDLDSGTIEEEKLEGVDVVVHLAAEPIGVSRGAAARRRIRQSRVVGTRLIAETLARLDDPPQVLVSASAVGVYGNRGDELLTEASPAGHDHLARVCAAWEVAATPAAEAGIRVVHPRTGVIVAQGSPLIDTIRVPFSLGVGGRVGDGRQYVPWIALEDEIRAFRFMIDTELEGPVNCAAPTAVTNREMTRALGEVMRRPTLLPIPPIAVRLVYGELAATLATASQRAVPQRLLDAGFTFRHTHLTPVLRAALCGDTATR